MDSKHRHELMHNELADWIGKLPGLAKEYRNQIIGVVLVIIGLISWPMLNQWRAESDLSAQAQVIEKISAAEIAKYMAISAYSQPDPNILATSGLLAAANELAEQVNAAPNKDLAALALVKQAQTLRTELLLKKEVVPQDIIESQIKKAQEAYQQALDKAGLPAIKAMAQLGLGLCSEELGQLDQAKSISTTIVGQASYAGTPFITIAQNRIDNIDDNNARYTFIETPKKAAPELMPTYNIDAAPAPAQPAVNEPNNQTK
jgi:predicted negative regulator of RcsB-dependent stress response